jgi:hypothetical protein
MSPASVQGAPFPTRLAIQPDGRIVMAATADGGFALARYNVDVPGEPDGTADASFNPCGQLSKKPCGGVVVGPADFPGYEKRTNRGALVDGAFPYAVGVQPKDGRIVVAGYGPYAPGDFLLARYNPNRGPRGGDPA